MLPLNVILQASLNHTSILIDLQDENLIDGLIATVQDERYQSEKYAAAKEGRFIHF